MAAVIHTPEAMCNVGLSQIMIGIRLLNWIGVYGSDKLKEFCVLTGRIDICKCYKKGIELM